MSEDTWRGDPGREGESRAERRRRDRMAEEALQGQAVALRNRMAGQGAHWYEPGTVVARWVKGRMFRLMFDSRGRAHLLRPGTRPTVAELDARRGEGSVTP